MRWILNSNRQSKERPKVISRLLRRLSPGWVLGQVTGKQPPGSNGNGESAESLAGAQRSPREGVEA
jgi:hypothetical protein